jgi:hypothetical protein
MKGTGMKILYVFLSVGIFFIMSCAPPSWVSKGSGAFDLEKGKVFRGVSEATGIKKQALLLSTADNRARAEFAKVFETYIAILVEDYISSTTAGDMSTSSEGIHIMPPEHVRKFIRTLLNKAKIIDHWKDQTDGTQFSLCELELLALKNALDDYKELDAEVRYYLRENAEKMHRQLEQMEREK